MPYPREAPRSQHESATSGLNMHAVFLHVLGDGVCLCVCVWGGGGGQHLGEGLQRLFLLVTARRLMRCPNIPLP